MPGPLPGLDAAVTLQLSIDSQTLLWWIRIRVNGTSPHIPLAGRHAHRCPGRERSITSPGDLDGAGTGRVYARPAAVARGARAGLERMVAIDAYVFPTAREVSRSPSRSRLDGQNTRCRYSGTRCLRCARHQPAESRPGATGCGSGRRHARRGSVRDAYTLPPIPKPSTQPGCNSGRTPHGVVRKSHGADVKSHIDGVKRKVRPEMSRYSTFSPSYEVRPLPHFNAHHVRIGVPREPEIQPSAVAFLLETR